MHHSFSLVLWGKRYAIYVYFFDSLLIVGDLNSKADIAMKEFCEWYNLQNILKD